MLTVPNILSALRLLGVPLFPVVDPRSEADCGRSSCWRSPGSRIGSTATWPANGIQISRWVNSSTLSRIACTSSRPDRTPAARHRALVVRAPARLPRPDHERRAAVLKRRGVTGLPVHFLGKAATFCLLYAFPLLLLGDGTGGSPTPPRSSVGPSRWGTALYWWAAVCTWARHDGSWPPPDEPSA